MITRLTIKNYTLIEDIQVNMEGGLTIITGETGAGKSILLGALSLLLGKRADLNSAKNPDKKCVIEAEFSIAEYDLEPLFVAHDMDFDAHTILRREILPGGKSRAFVNDSPVTLQQLQAIGPYLIDIHSQHETLSLNSETFQLEMIDAVANTSAIVAQYQQERQRYLQASTALETLRERQAASLKEADYNTFLLNELQEARLEGVDQEALEATYEKLNNSESITEGLSRTVQLFSQEPAGILENAKEARKELARLQGFASEYQEAWERIHSVIIELEDLEETLVQLAEEIESDPQALYDTNAQLQRIHQLQQKHAVGTVAELVAIQKELSEAQHETETLAEKIENAVQEETEWKSKATRTATELGEKRRAAIPALQEELIALLGELGLPNAQFDFHLERSETFREIGMDHLELRFSANKGSRLGPLKKVASGGELSRIMMAIKAILSRYKHMPTLIFDEIDTGVSGEIAQQMANLMQRMSGEMQLLSITHLPQIAAKGTNHLKVFKEETATTTITQMKRLTKEERIAEIAEMIGGKQLSDSAIAHAKELLN
ncbi:DNA repair protein RecN [Altibacter sp. HG106]|uniref:DNA repair protein RecN n=1 Tax=Altibacter sp. HG106 TaxID=3023937 RepID=UPI00234FC92C|nr:DNA repair protein RecN [Altibacter sp. HG106]MDC7995584.1 DNA repair protein RecN [Altibacter sp. HG106]